MSYLTLFLLSLLISFVGSLQLGPVNSEVLRFSIRGKHRAALLTGLGGSIPEFPYAWLATYLADGIGQYEHLRLLFTLIFVGILIIMGIRMLVKNPVDFPIETYQVKRKAFMGGFILAAANPQLIFFWSGILVWLDIHEYTTITRLSASLGASVGALLLQLVVVQIGSKIYRRNKLKNLNTIDNVMGSLMLLLAAWFLYRLLL
ncbi:MAG: hypothetical protein GC180_00955 [Bacteroidetes bacterium]|nr:hypothetical protein [Bacteroidota bacterium]